MVSDRRLQYGVASLIVALTLVWNAAELIAFSGYDTRFPILPPNAWLLALVLAGFLALGLYHQQRLLVRDRASISTPSRLPLLTALAFLLTLIISTLFVHLNHGHQITQKRTSALSLAASQGQNLGVLLNQARTTTTALAYLIQENHGELANFSELASGLLQSSPAISNLQLAPGGVVHQIHPPQGQEAAIGHDLFADPGRNQEALNAIKSRALTLAGPFELLQGGQGLVARQPVYLREPGRGEQFWGFTTALVMLDNLLARTGLDTLQARGYAWRLQRPEPGGGYRTFAGSEAPLAGDPVTYDLPVPNGRWQLALTPSEGWSGPTDQINDTLLILLSTLLVTLLVFNAFKYPLQLSSELAERTASLNRERMLLRQAEALSRTGSWSYDRRSRQRSWSEELYEILQVPRQQSPLRPLVLERIHPADRAEVLNAWRRLVFGTPYQIEYRLDAGGQTLWMRETAVAERGSSRHVQRMVGVTQDITRQKALERELRTLTLAVEHSPAATVFTTAEPRIIYVNPRFTQVTGYSLDEVMGTHPNFWEAPKPTQEVYRDLWKKLEAGEVWEGQLWNRRKDGSAFLEKVAITPVINEDGEITHYVAVNEDITEKWQMEQTIWRQANFDQLTGLANRARFNERCEIAIDRARRRKERALLLYLDLNKFKPINDRYGHQAGDAVLKEFAARLKEHIRSSDTAARIGGDEFTVLLEDLPSNQPIEALIEKLHRHLITADYTVPDGRGRLVEVPLGTSIGFALFPDHGQTPSELMRHADQGMYKDKRTQGAERESR
ncbi:diguanylate cyclase domain-containing protein [Motiliproteus sp. SC1-56]|uniref:sensor domain-containing diguanylate cyclase n=1 Tax=Motiliproteus sp. SC1-56 TaxID=2799565 RepID=UPI001A902126|nr:diguanylate cyclase [Motiliproteus sp. SC1-56]